MFPNHEVVTIASYGAIQDGRGEIDLTGTFGDDVLIAGSGDRVNYEMNWSPGVDTFVGGKMNMADKWSLYFKVSISMRKQENMLTVDI